MVEAAASGEATVEVAAVKVVMVAVDATVVVAVVLEESVLIVDMGVANFFEAEAICARPRSMTETKASKVGVESTEDVGSVEVEAGF